MTGYGYNMVLVGVTDIEMGDIRKSRHAGWLGLSIYYITGRSIRLAPECWLLEWTWI